MKNKNVDPEKEMQKVLKIFKKRGTVALQLAKNEVASEKLESPEIREALTYFMKNYWRDTARPALLSLACEAVGGKAEATTPIAVSAILTSGAADIHDDIIDGSKTKQIGPTVYGKFGKDIALLAGDALLFKGLTSLFKAAEKDISLAKLSAILEITKRTFFELGDAEALELHLSKRADVTPEEYLHILEKKAIIVEGYCQIGAILGDGSQKEIKDLGKYGRALGMLIMLRDDLIDMIDIEETRHRMERESLPLPIIYALQNPKTKSIIAPFLQKKNPAKKDANFIVEKAREVGGIKQCQNLMKRQAKNGLSCLASAKNRKRELSLLIRALSSL